MAYTPKSRLVTEESVLAQPEAETQPGAAKPASAASAPTASPSALWDGMRMLIPTLSSIAKDPGFLADKNRVLQATRESLSFILQESSIASKTLKLNKSTTIEALSWLYQTARQEERWKQPGELTKALVTFSTNLKDTDIPAENLRYLADRILQDPAQCGIFCANLDKAFAAMIPEEEGNEGRPFFLSRLSGITPEQLAKAWKAANDWMSPENAPKEMLFWGKNSDGREARGMVRFAVATQFALLHQYLNEAEQKSPEVAGWVIPDREKFLSSQSALWKKQMDVVASWFDEKHPPKSVKEFASVYATVLRESGDLTLSGIGELSDRLYKGSKPYQEISDPEKRKTALEGFWNHPKTQEKVSIAKMRVKVQRELFLAENPAPEENSIAKSIRLKDRAAIVEGLSPLWRGTEPSPLFRDLEPAPGGMETWIVEQESLLHEQARMIGRGLFHGVAESPEKTAITETLLREVVRQTLPELVRQKETVADLESALHDAVKQTMLIGLKILQPDSPELQKQLKKDFDEAFQTDRHSLGFLENQKPEERLTRGIEQEQG